MIFAEINRIRDKHGLMTAEELMSLNTRGVTVFDPFSTLITQGIDLREGTVIYPNVSILREGTSVLELGHKNIFHSGTRIIATTGNIIIGSGNEIGEGGIVIKTNTTGSYVTIGSGGRFMGGAQISGRCAFGDGAQVLGNVSVADCTLGGGQPYSHFNPDERGAVIKGSGRVRSMELCRGEVVNCQSTQPALQVERQAVYHAVPAGILSKEWPG